MRMTWDFILRIFVAGLLGGLIGFEREFRAKEAGVRTHFIVALGSALFMIISQYAFKGQFDHARVAAQVVSGIGFIGAGVIIFQKNAVRGVTTAAGLWVAAAIGLACGSAMYPVAAAATLMTILVLETMHFITRKYGEKTLSVSLFPVDNEGLLKYIDAFENAGIEVDSFTVSDGKASLQIRFKTKDYTQIIKSILSITEGKKVEIV
ncbi:MAG: MgtC/SapB family protein [Bacteroidales bacterium]|nr:MgtC/SapB family protein [Bacteroidales bacterium]